MSGAARRRADFDPTQSGRVVVSEDATMRPFLFRCPTTGLQVQGWVADDVADEDDAFVTVACTACLQAHFVNAITGRVLGDEAGDD